LNQARFLGRTINSVIDQNYPALAYHVQDGGSIDGSLDVLRSYGGRIGWSSEVDTGQSSAINAGFRGVNGDIMGYLNSDDMLLPGSLAYVARMFTDRPDVDVVYSHRINIDEEDREIGRWILPPHDPEALRWADYLPQETMFWRRRVWERAGPFDESLQFAMDWDFILRAEVWASVSSAFLVFSDAFEFTTRRKRRPFPLLARQNRGGFGKPIWAATPHAARSGRHFENMSSAT
jgi:glycosyltransferase involved in cell wall biosynthesis